MYSIAVAPQLGIVLDKNMLIVEVVPGSAAEQAGLHTEDVLEALDNTTVTSPTDAMQVTRQAIARLGTPAPEQTLSLAFRRGQTHTSIQVRPAPPKDRPGQATPTPVPSDYDYL